MNQFIHQINTTWLEPNSVARATGLYMFLRISPSYALAHSIKTKKIPTTKHSTLVSDLYEINQSDLEFLKIKNGFNKVLNTYDVVGDVYKRPFDTWFIKDKGYRLFGYDEAPPKAEVITSIKDSEKFSDKHIRAITRYFGNIRTDKGDPPLHLISIPAGIGVSKQIELLREMLSDLEANTPAYATSKPFFSFNGQRFRLDPIEKYLKMLTLRAIAPYRPLWQLAAITDLSNTIKFKDPWIEKANSQNLYERSLLNPLASRAISRAQKIAEHASQGVFPSHEKIAIPKYDWETIAKRLQ